MRLSPKKIIAVISLSSGLMPINSAGTVEVFVVFKRTKVGMKTFVFLKLYGTVLLGSLYEVCSLDKIHHVHSIPEITLLSQR